MSEETVQHDLIDLNGTDKPAGDAPKSTLPEAELNRITDDLISAFKTVFDPEIPVDIYELGLI